MSAQSVVTWDGVCFVIVKFVSDIVDSISSSNVVNKNKSRVVKKRDLYRYMSP